MRPAEAVGARVARLARAALLAALASGCAPDRGSEYERAVAEARRAAHAGRFDAARERYAEAASKAKLPRDAVYARYSSAMAAARAGDAAYAARELGAIADANPPNDYSPQAAFKLAELSPDETERAAQLEAVVVKFPESGVAQVAALKIARRDDELVGQDRAIAHLEALTPKVAGRKVEQTLTYERAKRLAALGKTETARDVYLVIAAKWPYPFGSYFDDSLFHASEMEEKLGRLPEALAHLERLLSQRETSSLMGSYERPKYVPSVLRLADLYETKLNDRARARSTLHRLYADFKTSTLRDDALWREAELWRKDGDDATACRRLATLTSDFPDSRFVPCAIERCPGLVRPRASKAPASCRPYLTRGPIPTRAASEPGGSSDSSGEPDGSRAAETRD